MTKKIIASLLALIILTGLVACDTGKKTDTETQAATESDTLAPADAESEDENNDEKPKAEAVTTKLNSSTKGIKILGERYLSSDEQINCDWTGSGIEFVINSTGGEIVFEAESDGVCYFRAYVDSVAWNDPTGSMLYKVEGKSTIKLISIPKGEHTVTLVKATGYALATAQLYSVTYYGTLSETAPSEKDMYIEFIGDSALCGTSSGAAQDGTQAYPYLIAKALNADYSIVAVADSGLATGSEKMADNYYLTSPERSGTELYSFERKADVVVIAIGAEDYAANMTEADFAKAYGDFIDAVREKNGSDCKIVCLYNGTNDTFSESILSVCRELGGQKSGVYSYKMTRSGSEYPTSAEHTAYAEALKSVVKNAYDGVITEKFLNTNTTGDGMSVTYEDFKPLT